MQRVILNCLTLAIALLLALPTAAGWSGDDTLGAGALGGNRYRVIVSSDIGGGDEDDDQSMVHYLLYADLFDTEGFVSSPPKNGRKKDFIEVIDKYTDDYTNLKTWSGTYPTPASLRAISKQGAENPAPEAGYDKPTEGSKWIIQCAKKKDPRPLYILVWGSITDVAQALHDDPSIKEKIRVYFIASWNRVQDPNSFAYIDREHKDLWMVYCDTTFRGWYMGGEQKGDLDNRTFVSKYAAGHGALGDYFKPLKGGQIKMGDTPSVAFLLRGTPDDPEQPSWGGQFVRQESRPNWWLDNPAPQLAEAGKQGAKTVNKWREAYLHDFAKRLNRCAQKNPGKAYVINERLGRGVNIIGYDQALWNSGGKAGRFQARHFRLIKEAGFNSVRINMHPFRKGSKDESGNLSRTWLDTLDWALKCAQENDLLVVLDFHEFGAMGDDPEGHKNDFLNFWRQLAPYGKDWPETVVFEILNEASNKLTPELWNGYLAEALAIIRKTNPERVVVVGPAFWNSMKYLKDLRLPEDDQNIIVTTHYYLPMSFTHQGAPWSDNRDKTGVTWNGTAREKAVIENDFRVAQAWSLEQGRPIFLGEFGAYDKAEMPSKVRYLRAVTAQAETFGWSWAYWQFDSDFILYDIPNDKWTEPIRDAVVKRD